MRKPIIGVMGPGKEASELEIKNACNLGELIAKNDWITLSGGTKNGVMDAVNKGAKAKGGLTVGVLPYEDPKMWSDYLDIPIVTNMLSGRNYINALSCDIMVACGMGPGTATEVAHAIQAKKPIILLNNSNESKEFFNSIGKGIYSVDTPEEVIKIIKTLLKNTKGL